MTKDAIDESAEEIPLKESKTRKEIEAMLKRIGVSLDSRINIVDLDSGERHLFDSYPQAMEFIKGKKGRWYVTSPGVRYSMEEH